MVKIIGVDQIYTKSVAGTEASPIDSMAIVDQWHSTCQSNSFLCQTFMLSMLPDILVLFFNLPPNW